MRLRAAIGVNDPVTYMGCKMPQNLFKFIKRPGSGDIEIIQAIGRQLFIRSIKQNKIRALPLLR